MRVKANRPPLKPANSSGRKWSISGKESTARAPPNKPSPLDYRKPGGPACDCRRQKKERLRAELASRRSATWRRGGAVAKDRRRDVRARLREHSNASRILPRRTEHYPGTRAQLRGNAVREVVREPRKRLRGRENGVVRETCSLR
jgi:hypothetical protein